MKIPSWVTKSGALWLVTGAIGAIGVIKSIAELVFGGSLSIQETAFYIGASAFLVEAYVGVMMATVVILREPWIWLFLTEHGTRRMTTAI